ncbi:hypothetical protein ACWDSJ_35845 [Nocardia sp. NPDC003482]
MLGNYILDQFDPKVRQVAEAVFTPSADEVLVLDAAPTRHLGEDQPTGSTFLMAAVAEQEALQIVAMDPVALPPAAAGLHHFLHPLEQFGRDDRLVPARVDVALVDDEAHVVGVAQHVV